MKYATLDITHTRLILKYKINYMNKLTQNITQ